MIHPLAHLQELIASESRTLARIVDESWDTPHVGDAHRNEMAGQAYAYYEPRIEALQAKHVAMCGKRHNA